MGLVLLTAQCHVDFILDHYTKLILKQPRCNPEHGKAIRELSRPLLGNTGVIPRFLFYFLLY